MAEMWTKDRSTTPTPKSASTPPPPPLSPSHSPNVDPQQATTSKPQGQGSPPVSRISTLVKTQHVRRYGNSAINGAAFATEAVYPATAAFATAAPCESSGSRFEPAGSREAADPLPPSQTEALAEKDGAAAASKARDVTRVVKIIKQNEPLVSRCRDGDEQKRVTVLNPFCRVRRSATRASAS